MDSCPRMVPGIYTQLKNQKLVCQSNANKLTVDKCC